MSGNRIWVLATALAIAAVLGLGWLLGVSPKLAEADLALGQQRSVEAQNAVHEATLVSLREQFERMDEIEAELTELRAEIPESPELDAFIDSVNAIAGRTGVTVARIATTEAVAFGGAAGTTTDTEADTAATSDSPVFMIQVSIAVTGPPVAVVDFSERLQLGTRLFFTPSFAVDSLGETGNFTGYLYVLPDPRASAPDEEAEGEESTENAAP